MTIVIHPTAQVAEGARLADGVEIGPFCTVGPQAEFGPGVRLLSHVNVTGCTTIGARTVIYPFASLGAPPQSVHYHGGDTRLIIGADCQIRENFTANTGTEGGGGVTRIGDGCFMMVNSHVAHDCEVGNNVTFANNAVLAGHVQVGDNVTFGGQAAVRQFVRIGRGAMITGMSGVRADVIPWGIVQGPLAALVGLNVVGMRRRGFDKAAIRGLRRVYQQLFFGEGAFRARVEALAAANDDPLVGEVIAFIQKGGARPLTMGARRHAQDGETE